LAKAGGINGKNSFKGVIMNRSYLVPSLLFALLICSGCAKKTIPNVEAPTAPAAKEAVVAAPITTTAVVENKPIAPQATEILHSLADKGMETVLFDYDSYALTANAQALLKNNAEWLLRNPEVKAIIEGHCDERGSDEYNLALGERRALAAKHFRAEQGVAPERLASISYGEERPASTGHTEMAWKQNRRVEFR
jgi:peptidoglycan-associated lipoprotein